MIPQGWVLTSLHQLGGKGRPILKAGPFGSAITKQTYVASGFKVYGQQEVLSGDLNAERYYISESAFRRIASCAVVPGDVLITMMGTVGKILEIPDGAEPGVINPRLMRISVDRSRVLPNYLVRVLRTEAIQRLLDRRAHGGTMPGLNAAAIGSLTFLLPPLPEQRQISEILSTWDRAIETVEALIANARAQKKALMQSLLTGKKRLPGFAGEWATKTLDDLFTFRKGQGLSKEAVTPSGVRRCILYGELYTRYPEVIDKVVGRTNSNEGFPSQAGDVLIPASTTTTGVDLANATAVLESGVLLSGDINVLRPKDHKQSAPFFAYLLTHVMKREIASRAQGITIVHLYGSDLKPVRVRVPDVDEQHAIADIILAADGEIASLRSQLAALRKEKSALMQQLLTGKRRVKVGQREAA